MHGAELGPLGKITFRAALAAGVSFVAAILLGSRLIGWLNRRFREPVVSDSAEIRELHQHKQWTPTMGGLFLVAGLLGATVILGDLTQSLPADCARDAHGVGRAWRGRRSHQALQPRRWPPATNQAGWPDRDRLGRSSVALWRSARAAGRTRSDRSARRPSRRTGLALHTARHAGGRRLVERREPDRRTRRTGRRLPACRRLARSAWSLMPAVMPSGPPISICRIWPERANWSSWPAA